MSIATTAVLVAAGGRKTKLCKPLKPAHQTIHLQLKRKERKEKEKKTRKKKGTRKKTGRNDENEKQRTSDSQQIAKQQLTSSNQHPSNHIGFRTLVLVGVGALPHVWSVYHMRMAVLAESSCANNVIDAPVPDTKTKPRKIKCISSLVPVYCDSYSQARHTNSLSCQAQSQHYSHIPTTTSCDACTAAVMYGIAVGSSKII